MVATAAPGHARRAGLAPLLTLAGLLAASIVLPLGLSAAAQDSSHVLVTPLRGPVTPVVAERIIDALEEAESGGAQALLVEMDTPGGLDRSMRSVVQAFLGAGTPVIVYVSPAGSRAASAGALIGFSAHILAMAPETTIGAVTPAAVEDAQVDGATAENPVAFVAAVARRRGRDVDFASAIIREGRSVAAFQAVDEGVADLVADSHEDLLGRIDGRTVQLGDGRTVTLATAGAEVVARSPTLIQGLLERVVDPNLVFLFITIGTLAILHELANPGFGVGGVVGVLLLLLAFYALSVLPVNLVGVLLLALAIALLVAEVFVPGIGVLAAGGAASLVAAGLMLFRGASGLAVDMTVLAPIALLAGGGAAGLAALARRLRRKPPLVGQDALVGQIARVRKTSGHVGQVLVNGKLWSARSVDHPLRRGTTVRIIEHDGPELTVSADEQEQT